MSDTTTTKRRCPLCRDWMPATARFCGTCGQALPGAPVARRAPDFWSRRSTLGAVCAVLCLPLLAAGALHLRESAVAAQMETASAASAPRPEAAKEPSLPFVNPHLILPCGHPQAGAIIGGGVNELICTEGHHWRESAWNRYVPADGGFPASYR